jgi:hypothetical protein
MAKLTTWSVYDAEGHYIGQTEAYAVEAALTRCLAMKGEMIEESEIKTRPIDGNSYLVEHQSDKFVVRWFNR